MSHASEVKFVYRISNSQRMALCTLIHEYMMTLQSPRNVMPERFVDCSVPDDEGLISPEDLLKVFVDTSETEDTSR